MDWEADSETDPIKFVKVPRVFVQGLDILAKFARKQRRSEDNEQIPWLSRIQIGVSETPKHHIFVTQKPSLPPCPPKLPILGNLHQLGAHPHRSLAKLAQQHGTVMHVQLGCRVPALIISSASAAEKIMKTHDLIFSSRPQSSITNRLLYNCKEVAFAPYGEYWRQMRKICVVHLLSSKRVQSFRLVREEEVANMVVELRNLSSSSGG
ncbi:hypothetical protein QJS10_CPA16g00466 [Acorus calamus]|uniref:Uncharacterized protein n=1 Tax=Acorus calamus TaxID=4465 RepID=A0AAV9CXY0_ACOCL|nr:hypothetical protein QJS10_CPA16g00466 [Acorus calamus]